MNNAGKHRKAQQSVKTPLMIATDETADVKGCCKRGLGALGAYRSKVRAADPNQLLSSIDIDSAVRDKYPDASRWDYAIEYGKQVFFMEVHHGSTGEASEVMKKLEWLKRWLETSAPQIKALKAKDRAPYYWVFTNKFNILKTSHQYRQLVQVGLVPTRELNL